MSIYSRQLELDVGHIVLMHRRRGPEFANRVFHRICNTRDLMRWEQIVLAARVVKEISV